MPKIILRFTEDVAYSPEYVDPEEDKAIDKILEGIAVSKSQIPCG